MVCDMDELVDDARTWAAVGVLCGKGWARGWQVALPSFALVVLPG